MLGIVGPYPCISTLRARVALLAVILSVGLAWVGWAQEATEPREPHEQVSLKNLTDEQIVEYMIDPRGRRHPAPPQEPEGFWTLGPDPGVEDALGDALGPGCHPHALTRVNALDGSLEHLVRDRLAARLAPFSAGRRLPLHGPLPDG